LRRPIQDLRRWARWGLRMRILITGVSARALAESACRAGRAEEVLTVDYFGDLDLKRSCENYSLLRDARCRYSVARLLRSCVRFQWDAVVYAADLENYPGAVGRLAAERNPQLRPLPPRAMAA